MKTFRQFSNHVVTALVCGLTAAAVLLLAFVLFFIVKEALPLFDTVGVSDFLLGQKWMPVDYTGVTSFGIFNFIAATAYVSLTGLVLAAGIGLGTAMFLAFQATPRMRTVMYPLIDLLAGIPSVVYGLVGMLVCGMGDYIWYYPRAMMLFWFVFGILVAAARLAKQEADLIPAEKEPTP